MMPRILPVCELSDAPLKNELSSLISLLAVDQIRATTTLNAGAHSMNPQVQTKNRRRSLVILVALLVFVGLIGYGLWFINDEYDLIPSQLSQKTIEAWKREGFEFGYLRPAELEHLPISSNDKAVALPTFTYTLSHGPHSRVQFAMLPAPEVPFRLYWQDSDMGHFRFKLVTRFTKMTELNTGFAPVTDDELKWIASLRKLTHLSLRRSRITDAGLKHLAPLRRLKMIDLSYTGVTGTGFKDLAGLKHLTTIVLTQEQLTDETVANLTQMGLLHNLPGFKTFDDKRPMKVEDVYSLDLRNSRLTDAGLKGLAPFKNLILLDMTGSKVTEDGVAELQKALPYCKISR
jgi:hypothetical protein